MSTVKAVAATQGWDATQWVALVGVIGAVAGPLLGVWFGKRIERTARREASDQAEQLESTRALKEAITQVELLLPNIDSALLLKKVNAGLPLPDIAATDESKALYAQEERVQLLLVQASMVAGSQEIQTLLESLRTRVRDGVLTAIALLAEVAQGQDEGERASVLKALSARQTTDVRRHTDNLRLNLNMFVPQRLAVAETRNDWDELMRNDPRLLETPDVLSNLKDNPNLMDLDPPAFEALIANLFSKIGYDTALTRPGPAGGVDVLAIDHDPISGGKVVIAAKRYRHRVPVEAVRDLYGTMVHENAVKGVLVTTSDFTTAGHQFASDKPIQLLSGSNLLYLLERYAGIQARIEATR